jgi:hypothetical protein
MKMKKQTKAEVFETLVKVHSQKASEQAAAVQEILSLIKGNMKALKVLAGQKLNALQSRHVGYLVHAKEGKSNGSMMWDLGSSATNKVEMLKKVKEQMHTLQDMQKGAGAYYDTARTDPVALGDFVTWGDGRVAFVSYLEPKGLSHMETGLKKYTFVEVTMIDEYLPPWPTGWKRTIAAEHLRKHSKVLIRKECPEGVYK